MSLDGDAFFVDNIRFLEGSDAMETITDVKGLKDSKDLKGSEYIYNLAGQRLNDPQSHRPMHGKGIYITRGRKLLVK